MSNNLLISDKLVEELYAEPTVVSMYHSERSVPKGALFLRRAARMGRLGTSTPSTLSLLGRILRAGALAYGYLQLARPSTDVHVNQVISILKTISLRNAYYLQALAKPYLDADPGILQVGFTQPARDALRRLESYDPAFMYLIATRYAGDGTTRISIRGDGSNPESDDPHGLFELDLAQDYEITVDGIQFPKEVLF